MIGGIEGRKDEGFKLAQNGSAEGGRDENHHMSALS